MLLFAQVGEDSGRENSRELHQLREQLQQQSLQTKQALAQLLLVREQLLSETNARMEAQVSVFNGQSPLQSTCVRKQQFQLIFPFFYFLFQLKATHSTIVTAKS